MMNAERSSGCLRNVIIDARGVHRERPMQDRRHEAGILRGDIVGTLTGEASSSSGSTPCLSGRKACRCRCDVSPAQTPVTSVVWFGYV